MTRTVSNFAAPILISLAAFIGTPTVSAVGVHPPVVCDRHPPGMYGPFHFSVDYNDCLGFVFDPKYINNIGPYDAFSLEFAFGAKEFRGAFTWGHILHENHFIKTSIEYFAQEPNFRFVSGKDSEWVGQKGFGFEYAYLPQNLYAVYKIFLGIEYTNAECESLKTITLDDDMRDYRRISGARDWAGYGGFSVEAWEGGQFDLIVYHDSLKFRNKNKQQNTLVGIGGTLEFRQRFGTHAFITLSGTDRQPFYQYIAKATVLADTAPGTKIEIYCRYMLSSGDAVPNERENRYALGINYSWGGNKYRPRETYNDPLELDLTDKLVDYANIPAVRPPQVFAQVDERVS